MRGGPTDQIVSVKRTADRKNREARKLLIKREKRTDQERIFAEHLDELDKNELNTSSPQRLEVLFESQTG